MTGPRKQPLAATDKASKSKKQSQPRVAKRKEPSQPTRGKDNASKRHKLSTQERNFERIELSSGPEDSEDEEGGFEKPSTSKERRVVSVILTDMS